MTGRGQLLVVQDGEVVLLAQVCRFHTGADYLRTNRFRSPVSPIRAAHARDLVAGDTDSTLSRWAHHFARELAATNLGPLQTGQWAIGRDAQLRAVSGARSPAERWGELLLTDDPDGFIDWLVHNGSGQVLPLRRLSDVDDGRVKAYRKQAREGCLPPILLWWISGLDCSVVLDGHDRFRAALLENQEPPMLTLQSVLAARMQHETNDHIARYSAAVPQIDRQVRAGVPGAAEALAAAHRVLGERVQNAAINCGRTSAWPLPGGDASWWAAVRLHSSGEFAATLRTQPYRP
ncbi:hypothetical protein [Melissospora conviva]|uniref:hypothetical protein n=1 Tax=Melissospora conviva TaxID=3388432 RepID=UPI003B7DEB06